MHQECFIVHLARLLAFEPLWSRSYILYISEWNIFEWIHSTVEDHS